MNIQLENINGKKECNNACKEKYDHYEYDFSIKTNCESSLGNQNLPTSTNHNQFDEKFCKLRNYFDDNLSVLNEKYKSISISIEKAIENFEFYQKIQIETLRDSINILKDQIKSKDDVISSLLNIQTNLVNKQDMSIIENHPEIKTNNMRNKSDQSNPPISNSFIQNVNEQKEVYDKKKQYQQKHDPNIGSKQTHHSTT